MVQKQKKFCLSNSISEGLYIIWFSFMVHIYKMIISPRVFFIFSKFWFLGLRGKRAKTGPKWEEMLCSMFQEPYIIQFHSWYTYVKWHLQMLFSFIKNFDFLDSRGVKMAKNGPKWEKILCRTLYLRNHKSYYFHLWYSHVKWWYLQGFSSFQDSDFLGC